MSNRLFGLTRIAAAVAVVSLYGTGVHSQGGVTPINDLPNPYETISDWGKFPGGRVFGIAILLNQVSHESHGE